MSLPFDSSDPQIRLALQHVRLQALIPTSVLVNLATAVICAFAINPSLQSISKSHPTPLNGSPPMLGMFLLVVFVLLIGHSLLLMIARKKETKETIVHGAGIRLVLLQWVMALNFVAFTLEWFIASLVFSSISLFLLIWIHITLYQYPSARTRPLDIVFIHLPLRLLLVFTFLQILPQTLFVALGWLSNHHRWRWENNDAFSWHGVAFIVGLNVVGLVEVALWKDIAWTVAGICIQVAQLIHKPKPSNVSVANLVFIILYPIVFIAIEIWTRFRDRGAIRLPDDEVERQEIARARAASHRP